jgi:hypothetical protein
VWAKPVLFAHLPDLAPAAESLPEPPQIAAWAPAADGATLIVVDLPGVCSVQLAEALVHVGFRPVPLFNAVPGPLGSAAGLGAMAAQLVEVTPILEALNQVSARAAAQLKSLPPSAPPAFLLDRDRADGRAPRPGDFDNRSISLPTDFPSASFLQARGIKSVLLILDDDDPFADSGVPARDLAHTLLRWQTAGIALRSCVTDDAFVASAPREITVVRPKWFKAIWHSALALVGLKRNPLGGFGGVLPMPGSG